jgi:hypothetical protein
MTSRSLSFSYKSIDFFSSISQMWARMDHRKLNTFFWFFLNLVEVQLCQFGIKFGKHVEIHLNDRK